MLAVVKTPHIDLKIKGTISPSVIKALRKEYGDLLKIKPEADEEMVNIFNTELYKEFKKNITHGEYVKTYRENLGLTQDELGKKIGVSRAYICDIEHNRRSISKNIAKKLSDIFKISISKFI